MQELEQESGEVGAQHALPGHVPGLFPLVGGAGKFNSEGLESLNT